MKNEYIGSESHVAARARSKRLRDAGLRVTTMTTMTATAAAAATPVATADPNSHTHTNKGDLDKLSVQDGYVMITEKGTGEDGTTSALTEKVKAGQADVAKALTDDSEVWKALKALYLSKKDDDTAEGNITFAKDIVVGGAISGASAAIKKITATTVQAADSMQSPLFVGSLKGNADTATRLASERLVWGNKFDGSADITGNLMLGDGSLYGHDGALLMDNLKAGMGLARDTFAYAALGTQDYVSGVKGWNVTHAGSADFRNIYADELRVQAFTADIAQALAGSDYLTKSVSKLSENFTIPEVGGNARLIVDDLEGEPATQCFADGDYIRLRLFDRSGGGLTIANAWGTVSIDTTYGEKGFKNGEQAYTFKCTATTGGEVTAYKGSEVLDYGQSGDGLIVRTTLDKAGSPYAQVMTWQGDPGDASRYTLHARMGNLAGIAGCSGYGFYGENTYLTKALTVGDLTKAGNYLEYDKDRGLDIVANAFYIKTKKTPVPRDLGEWQQGWTCSYYDRVSHGGSLWLCTLATGSTEEEPTEESTVWERQVEKGGKGDKGDDAITVTIYTTAGNILRNGQQETTLTAKVYKGEEDITGSLADNLFSWTRESGNSDTDTIFGQTHTGYGKTLTLTAADVDRKATYDCYVNTDSTI